MSEARGAALHGATSPSAAARTRRRRLTFFWVVAALIVVVDQVTKRWIDASFRLSSPSAAAPGPLVPPTPVIDDLVRISKIYNNGALFGMFSSSAMVFAIGSIAVIAFIVWYEMTRDRGPWLLTVALTLLMGGAIGNLIDRLVQGYVVDFVDLGIGTARWYTSNLADGCISLSIVLLLVLSLFGDRLGADDGGPDPAGPGETGE